MDIWDYEQGQPDDNDDYSCPECGGQVINVIPDVWECQDCDYISEI